MYDNKVKCRLRQLELLLNRVDRLHLKDASEILNVSEMTIRRDVSNSKGSIILLGGYLVKEVNNRKNYFLVDQQDKNIIEKIQLGKAGAELIQNNDIVFFDCGTTIAFIASQIPIDINFTAVCCSINTFMILQENRNCNLILCGGSYSRDNSLLTSIQNQSVLDAICTTKAFIAASGVDAQHGVSCFRFNEAQIKQKAMSKTKQKILVFDHSKINAVHPAYIGKLDDFDMILCNHNLPQNFHFDRSKFIKISPNKTDI